MNKLYRRRFLSFLFSMILVTALSGTHAQVFNGDLVLTTQAQVDFMALTNYTSISGRLTIVGTTITGSDITNLDGLNKITSVGLTLDIFNNPLLVSITGLSALTSVGSNANVPADGQMSIVDNDALTDLAGLSNLRTIQGPLYIYDNAGLTNINALSGLVNFGYFLQISGNALLANINGLTNSLVSGIMDGISIFNNPSLANLDGIQNVVSTFSIHINNNPLIINLSALSGMIFGGSIEVKDNAALTDFTGLNDIANNCGLTSYTISGNGAAPPAALIARFDTCLANQKPVADAGDNAEVIQKALVQLDGSGSSDTENDPLTYKWTLISKPSGSIASLSANNIVNPTFTADLTGTYIFSLTVNDGFHNSIPDQVTYTAVTIQQALEEPIVVINQLPLGSGVKNSLKSKLANALKSYSSGNIGAAINQLNSFLNQLYNLVADGSITQTQAQPLIDYVTNLISMLNTMLKVASQEITQMPQDFALFQNFPNPFNPSTTIKWQQPVNSVVTIKVFDAIGEEVKTLVNGNYAAGSYEIQFNTSGMAAGIYFYRIIAGSFAETKKMILMK